MNEPHNEKTDEARIEALLKQAGPRITPPADLMNEVRAAVHDDWQQLVSERTRQRRVRWLAAAASVGTVAIVATTTVMTATDAREMAVAMRVDGHVTRDAGLLRAARTVSANSRVYVGDEIVTEPDGRVALAVADGIELRVDAETHVRLVDANRVMLERGAVYVDSDEVARSATAFVVATDHGSVRHIGTQYQVRATGNNMHVSVREGRVIVDSEGALHEGRAGELLEIGADGSVERSELNERDQTWRWIYAIAPTFDLENRSLDEFLSWFSRETGRKIEFSDGATQANAARAVLRGSISGLDPYAALEAVLATTGLSFVEKQDGTIVISP